MGVRTFRQYLTQKKIHLGFYRRRLVLIATPLVFTIVVLGLIQWATAFRGDLLWILMVALGFVLIGVLLGILRGRPLTAEEEEQNQLQSSKPHWERMIDESLDNDPHVIGSALYRGDDD